MSDFRFFSGCSSHSDHNPQPIRPPRRQKEDFVDHDNLGGDEQLDDNWRQALQLSASSCNGK